MSNTLKSMIALIVLVAAVGLYALKQNEAQFQAEFSPHQDLSTLMTTGKVELRTFKEWCASQGHQGKALDQCIEQRESKAKQLLELEKSQAQEVSSDSPTTIQ